VSEGIDVSQQPLFVPAPPGWYACPGDPPGITRHWDGKKWLCEIRGPVRDHFDQLRAMSVRGLSPDDEALLRQLTREVSAIEDLALSRPTANPPLVQIAAPPPYVPPPVDPYTSVPLAAHGMPGAPTSSGAGPRFAASGVQSGGRRKVVAGVVGLVVVLVLIVGGLALSGPLSKVLSAAPASLSVNSCITLSYPSGASGSDDVTWTSAACATAPGGPVSYTVIAKLEGKAACDSDSQYVRALSANKTVQYTYCLMENLTVGECVFQDDKGFFFDVTCADPRAALKVSVAVNQGSDFSCPDATTSWQYGTANRTYCLVKP